MSENIKPLELSDRELKLLAYAWLCMESEPKVNTTELAKLTGYTAGSASVTLNKVKKKLREHGSSVAANPPTPKKAAATPSKTPSKKRAAKGTAHCDETPTKKRRGDKKPLMPVQSPDTPEDSEDIGGFDEFEGKIKLEDQYDNGFTYDDLE